MPIDWLALSAAFMTGLLGGVHCIAMCGGIATGLSSLAPALRWRYAFEPNLGRVLGYAAAGGLAGWAGHGLVSVARSGTLETVMRAAAGAVLIFIATRLARGRTGTARAVWIGDFLWRWLKPLQRHLLPANTSTRRTLLGALWGWMPCGLSTTILTASWFQASPGRGALFMAAFGLGTLPVMVPLTWSGARLSRHLDAKGLRLGAALLVLLAGLLTLASPWLTQVPQMHGFLATLGCLPPTRR